MGTSIWYGGKSNFCSAIVWIETNVCKAYLFFTILMFTQSFFPSFPYWEVFYDRWAKSVNIPFLDHVYIQAVEWVKILLSILFNLSFGVDVKHVSGLTSNILAFEWRFLNTNNFSLFIFLFTFRLVFSPVIIIQRYVWFDIGEND